VTEEATSQNAQHKLTAYRVGFNSAVSPLQTSVSSVDNVSGLAGGSEYGVVDRRPCHSDRNETSPSVDHKAGQQAQVYLGSERQEGVNQLQLAHSHDFKQVNGKRDRIARDGHSGKAVGSLVET
jgi:hypothetical protein